MIEKLLLEQLFFFKGRLNFSIQWSWWWLKIKIIKINDNNNNNYCKIKKLLKL